MARTLYLVRHAEAIPRGSLEIDDHRWLTPEGRERFLRIARRFARREGARVELIWTSPLPRAVMTAELLAQALRFSGPLEVCQALTAEASAEQALGLLLERCRAQRVAAVGHEPMLGELLLRLLPGEVAAQALPQGKLTKGAIAALRLSKDGAAGAAELRYLLERKKEKEETAR